MASTLSKINDMQRSWASRHRVAYDPNGYTTVVDHNLLFLPLNEKTKTDFDHGDGGELDDRNGGPAKMRALHSSSALAVNFFDYWRERDASPLASALGISGPIEIEGFERKYPTGLPGHAPNLDLVIDGPSGKIAIESKFTEPFYKAKEKSPPFKDKYFPINQNLWSDKGLPHCQRLATDMQEGRESFTMLDAKQLLKHILGLQKSTDKPRLLYLWYSYPGNEDEVHRNELKRFAGRIDPEIHFRSLTYQELFYRFPEAARNDHQNYLDKLKDRYFIEG